MWVHETLIFDRIFVTLTENSSVLTCKTQGSREYPTPLEQAVGRHFHVQHGTKITTVFDLLVGKPPGRIFQVCLLAIWWYSVTRKHLFPRSDLRKPKEVPILITANTSGYLHKSADLHNTSGYLHKSVISISQQLILRFTCSFNQSGRKAWGARLVDLIKHLHYFHYDIVIRWVANQD